MNYYNLAGTRGEETSVHFLYRRNFESILFDLGSVFFVRSLIFISAGSWQIRRELHEETLRTEAAVKSFVPSGKRGKKIIIPVLQPVY